MTKFYTVYTFGKDYCRKSTNCCCFISQGQCRLAKTRCKIQELNFVVLKNHRTYFIDLKFDVDVDANVLNIGIILSILDHTADERNVELEKGH